MGQYLLCWLRSQPFLPSSRAPSCLLTLLRALWEWRGWTPAPASSSSVQGVPKQFCCLRPGCLEPSFLKGAPTACPQEPGLVEGGPCPVLGRKAHPGLRAGWMGGVSAVGSTLWASPPKLRVTRRGWRAPEAAETLTVKQLSGRVRRSAGRQGTSRGMRKEASWALRCQGRYRNGEWGRWRGLGVGGAVVGGPPGVSLFPACLTPLVSERACFCGAGG